MYFTVLLVTAVGSFPLSYGAVGRPRSLAAFSYIGLPLAVDIRIRGRRDAIVSALPAVLDLLTLSVEAGMSFDAALQRLVRRLHGPLIDELALMQRDMQLGTAARRGDEALAARVEAPEVTSFVRALSQADKLGVPLAQMLRAAGRRPAPPAPQPRPRSTRCRRRSRCCSRPCS